MRTAHDKHDSESGHLLFIHHIIAYLSATRNHRDYHTQYHVIRVSVVSLSISTRKLALTIAAEEYLIRAREDKPTVTKGLRTTGSEDAHGTTVVASLS
jgi:hypothetical protein